MWPEEKICLATLDFYLFLLNWKYGNKRCLTALAALAQETRLDRSGCWSKPDRRSAGGKIGERLGLAPRRCRFTLKELARADLVTTRHEGRFIYCSANFATMNGLWPT